MKTVRYDENSKEKMKMTLEMLDITNKANIKVDYTALVLFKK